MKRAPSRGSEPISFSPANPSGARKTDAAASKNPRTGQAGFFTATPITILCYTLAIGLALLDSGATAQADDVAAEIRALKAEIKRLEEKITREEQQVRGIAKFPKMPPAAVTPVVCKDAQCSPPPPPLVCKDESCAPPPPPPPVWVSFNNALSVESYDHDFSFRIIGRMVLDGGVSSQPIQAFAGFPAGSPLQPFFPAHPATGFANQTAFRQARLGFEGKAFKDWNYKFEYDFVGAPNGLVLGGIRDAFLAWRYFEPVTFQVGNFYEPASVDRMTFARNRDFIDRALPADVIVGNRHLGFAAVTGGDAPGLYGRPNFSLKGGIFTTSLEDGNPQAASATTNAAGEVTAINFGTPAGNSNLLNPLPGGHQYWDAAARLTYAPVRDEQHLLHLGGWIRYQNPEDATVANDDRVLQPGSTSYSEATILREGLLGTQPLTCFSAATQLVGTNCVKDVVNYGAELVASWGPFSIQGEYYGMHYDRNSSIIIWQQAPGGSSINFNGFYVYATWYLTGESRAEAYQSYPEDFNTPGTFRQIKILNPVSAGGWGAWELAARVSELNLNDGGYLVLQPIGTRPNIQGGRQTDFTLGLVWYTEPGIRFMANWVNVFQFSAPYNRPDLNGIHPQLFELRAQVAW